MPAEKTLHAIDHDDLAVVAEVDLEAVEPAAAGSEGADVHAAVTQLLAVGGRQGVAADAVIEHVDLHAFGGFF
ncbi:hypothetical protein D3C79_765040 [compost metagenome]